MLVLSGIKGFVFKKGGKALKWIYSKENTMKNERNR